MYHLKNTYSLSRKKYYFFLLILTLLYWNIVIRVAIFLRLLGTPENQFNNVLSNGIKFLTNEIIMSSVVISIFATVSWAILNFIYPKLVRKFHVRKLMIGIVSFDVIVFIIMGILLGIVHYSVEKNLTFIESIYKLKGFLINSTTLFFLIVLFAGSYVYQLLFTLLQQIGYSSLRKIMTGYYQKPREENLIFMFLDLQSSTSYAEKLGHEKYSYFIQDCFSFLSNPLLETMGRVYQFVGDEVVITWNANKLKNYKHTVDFFYLYEQELNDRRSYFEDKYGLMPQFTASINEGKVMAAEVGEIKRELAYHGDVLNTAARIQKQCKRYKKQILVTKNFASKLIKANTGYKINYIDIIKFIGKDRVVKIYEVYYPEA